MSLTTLLKEDRFRVRVEKKGRVQVVGTSVADPFLPPRHRRPFPPSCRLCLRRRLWSREGVGVLAFVGVQVTTATVG